MSQVGPSTLCSRHCLGPAGYPGQQRHTAHAAGPGHIPSSTHLGPSEGCRVGWPCSAKGPPAAPTWGLRVRAREKMQSCAGRFSRPYQPLGVGLAGTPCGGCLRDGVQALMDHPRGAPQSDPGNGAPTVLKPSHWPSVRDCCVIQAAGGRQIGRKRRDTGLGSRREEEGEGVVSTDKQAAPLGLQDTTQQCWAIGVGSPGPKPLWGQRDPISVCDGCEPPWPDRHPPGPQATVPTCRC